MAKLDKCLLEILVEEMDVGHMLAWSEKNLANPSVLVQSPRSVLLLPLEELKDKEILQDAFSIIIFGREGEARMEKKSRSQTGLARLSLEGQGDEYFTLSRGYLLRQEYGGKLFEREYYARDDSGNLSLRHSRLCGMGDMA